MASEEAAPSPSVIPWHRRLETRLLLWVTVAAALALAALLYSTRRVVTQDALARVATNQAAAKTSFDRLLDTRSGFAAAQIRLIAELPIFRAHLMDPNVAADRATIQALADHYRTELVADFCLITDAKGRWLGQSGWPERASPPGTLAAGIAGARRRESPRTILSIDGRLYLVVFEPAAFADELLGTIAAGYRLDDAVARDLAAITHDEVTLLSGAAISGTSLDVPEKAAIARLSAVNGLPFVRPGAGAFPQPLGRGRYVAGRYALSATDDPAGAGSLVLLEDWQPTQRFLDRMRRDLIGICSGTFLLALGASLFGSRRVTRPFAEIARMAG